MTQAAPGPDPAPAPARGARRGRLIVGLVAAGPALAAALVVIEWLTWPDVAALAQRPPRTTAFIEAYRARRRAAGEDDRVAWTWVPWSRISVHLKRAVISAEDLEFFFHHGFSRAEIEAAIRAAVKEGKELRGASTITQQLAKNLWLSPSRNPWRKVKEVLLARSLERHLTKRRMLEIYLNVVEFGPGVYGAEAAARRYFGAAAADLGEHQAALLAASLPRPSTWHPGVASRSYARYADEVERRMARASFLWKYLGETPPPAMPESLVIPESLLVPIPLPPPADSDTVALTSFRSPVLP
jgi:monofunctional biosynthetic peptidoglycan transglycosylase